MKKFIFNRTVFFLIFFLFFPFSASAFEVSSGIHSTLHAIAEILPRLYFSPKYFINKQENSFHAFKKSLNTSYNNEKYYHGNTYSGGAFAIGLDSYNGHDKDKSIFRRLELEFSIYNDIEILTDFNVDENNEKTYKVKETTVNSLFFNFYHDFHILQSFTPYIFFGVGLTVPYEKPSINFSGQIGTGFAINITEKFAFDVGFSYLFPLLDNKFFIIQHIYENKSEFSLYPTQKINLGLRFYF